MKAIKYSFAASFGCLGLLLMWPAAQAAENSAAPAAQDAVVFTPEQLAGFVAVDKDVARFEALVEKYPNPKYQGDVRQMLADFKVRAVNIRKNFDQTKFDELRYHINQECQRLAVWMAPPRTPAPGELNRLNPSPSSPTDVVVACRALFDEIERIERTNRELPAGPNREVSERVKQLWERYRELVREFTKPRWDEAVALASSR